MKHTFILLTALFTFTQCIGVSDEQKSKIISATGGRSEILIVMDTAQWRGAVGEEIREALAAPMAGMLRGEKYYSLRPIPAVAMNSVVQTHRNLIVLTTFDGKSPSAERMRGFFKPEVINKVSNDDKLFMLEKRNRFANDQMLLLLFGKDQATLLKNLKANREKIFRIFHENDLQRSQSKLKTLRQEKEIAEKISQQYGVSMYIPKDFKVAKQTKTDSVQGFYWLRLPDNVIDKNLIIAYKPYTSEKQFDTDSLVAWRNQIARTHLFGNPENPDSYVITETLEKPVCTRLQNNNIFTVEMRGLWKTKNVSMGGSFISYAFADNQQGRLFYVEGFIYAPSLDNKRESIKELEAVLRMAKPRQAQVITQNK